MKISYIIPHRNRTDLFRYNLLSLRHQTDKNFEVIVADHSDPEEFKRLLGLKKAFADIDMTILKIDHSKAKYKMDGVFQNPALSQNLGVSQAAGEVIILTSPEVINARTNVESIKTHMMANPRSFLLGWVDEISARLLPTSLMTKGINIYELKALAPMPGSSARCRKDNGATWKKCNYFLGAMLKENFVSIRGIELCFGSSVGYEDDDYAERIEMAGINIDICEEFAGLHLSHSRSYQNLNNPNKLYWESIRGKPRIANKDYAWAPTECISEIIK